MKVKKNYKCVIIGVLLFLVLGGIFMIGITGYITFISVTRLSTNEATGMDYLLEAFESIDFDYTGFQQKYKTETVHIKSTFDGHTIPADYVVSKTQTADTVIMVHGISGNRQSILPFAEMFLEQGYNVLAFDQRSAGENTAKHTTFGYLESYDVADCVSYLNDLLDKDQKIYVWGISNGAATVGISVRHEIVENRVTSIILDCPFSSTSEMMRIKLEKMKLLIPLDFMMFSGDLANRIALGFSYEDASACTYLAQSKLPVLIIASKADDFTLYWMAEKLEQASSHATLAFVEDSGHANIFFDHPDWYATTILNFISK